MDLALDRWAAHLQTVAASCADGLDAPLGLGALEAPFRALVAGGAPVGSAPEAVAGEVALWWAALDRRVDVDAKLAAPTAGSLFPQTIYRTIEVWTEAELCGLHALHRLARMRGRDDWAARVAAVRDWHLEHTQPDNATNRPWALHVFALGGTAESAMYAGTLLQNCLVGRGAPEPLSALILADAAREIRSMERPG